MSLEYNCCHTNTVSVRILQRPTNLEPQIWGFVVTIAAIATIYIVPISASHFLESSPFHSELPKKNQHVCRHSRHEMTWKLTLLLFRGWWCSVLFSVRTSKKLIDSDLEHWISPVVTTSLTYLGKLEYFSNLNSGHLGMISYDFPY